VDDAASHAHYGLRFDSSIRPLPEQQLPRTVRARPQLRRRTERAELEGPSKIRASGVAYIFSQRQDGAEKERAATSSRIVGTARNNNPVRHP